MTAAGTKTTMKTWPHTWPESTSAIVFMHAENSFLFTRENYLTPTKHDAQTAVNAALRLLAGSATSDRDACRAGLQLMAAGRATGGAARLARRVAGRVRGASGLSAGSMEFPPAAAIMRRSKPPQETA